MRLHALIYVLTYLIAGGYSASKKEISAPSRTSKNANNTENSAANPQQQEQQQQKRQQNRYRKSEKVSDAGTKEKTTRRRTTKQGQGRARHPILPAPSLVPSLDPKTDEPSSEELHKKPPLLPPRRHEATPGESLVAQETQERVQDSTATDLSEVLARFQRVRDNLSISGSLAMRRKNKSASAENFAAAATEGIAAVTVSESRKRTTPHDERAGELTWTGKRSKPTTPAGAAASRQSQRHGSRRRRGSGSGASSRRQSQPSSVRTTGTHFIQPSQDISSQ